MVEVISLKGYNVVLYFSILLLIIVNTIPPISMVVASSSQSAGRIQLDPSVLELFNSNEDNVIDIPTPYAEVLNDTTPQTNYREFIVIVKRDALNIVRDKVERIKYMIPLTNSLVFASVVVSREQLLDLADTPGIKGLTPSLSVKELFGDNVVERIPPETIEANNGGGGYDGSGVFGSLDVMRIRDAWETYGVSGDGVVVGVVDTGIDFGNPELGVEAIARDYWDYPITLTVDDFIGLTPVTVTAYQSGGRWYINTYNVIVPVYSTYLSGTNGYPYIYLVRVTRNYGVSPEIVSMSKSGQFKFGFFEWFFADYISGYYIRIRIPTLLIDSQTPGVYDKVVFDLSTTLYVLCYNLQSYGWRTPVSSWNDNSFADEPIFSYGNEVIARDLDGDGFADISLGSIAGTVIDSWGTTDYGWDPATRTFKFGSPGQRLGLDPSGKYIAIFTDYYGHGTSVATVIGARGKVHYNGYGGESYLLLGAAPGAQIAGATGWWFGDLVVAEYWLAGMNFVLENDVLYPVIGSKRSDLISNSWSYVNLAKWGHQAPGVDFVAALFNQLVLTCWSLGFNVTLVFAMGNYGPGYTTLSPQGSDLLIIGVGASTHLEYTRELGLPPGYSDDVAQFSSRGPNPLGYPKPDVLAIGAYEWAGVRVIDGGGYGIAGYWEGIGSVGPGLTLFGGTSEATPFTSGVLALAIEAFKSKYGYTPSPIDLKVLLKSSVDDVNYPAFSQGSGRINAYKLIKTIVDGDFVAYVKESMAKAFTEIYGNYYGISYEDVYGVLYDTAYYDVVPPGTSSTFSLIVKGTGVVNARAEIYTLSKQITIYSGVYYPTGDLWITIPRSDYLGYDYIEFYVVYKNITNQYPYYGITPINNQFQIRFVAYDSYSNLRYPINLDVKYSTTLMLTIGDPSNRLHGDLLLRLRPYTDTRPVNVDIVARFYKRTPFSWITLSGLPRYVNGETVISGTTTVPATATPGIYEFKIVVETPNKKIIVPGSIVVPLIVTSTREYYSIAPAKSPLTYDSYTPIGLTDPYYGTRTECLDWRIIPILVTGSDIAGLTLMAKWLSGPMTSLEILAIPPGGVVDAYGDLNTFAAYKLTGRFGYVYNPDPNDQKNGVLKQYIPVRWSLALMSLSVSYHYDATPTSETVRSVKYTRSGAELGYPYLGLYRIMIGYGSYSGSRVFDTIKLSIGVVKASQTVTYDPVTNTYTVSVMFKTSPLLGVFYNANVYALTPETLSDTTRDKVVTGIRRYADGSVEELTYVYGKYIENTKTRYLYTKTYTLTGTGYTAINTVLVLNNVAWHATGIYFYDTSFKYVSIYYPAIISITTLITNVD